MVTDRVVSAIALLPAAWRQPQWTPERPPSCRRSWVRPVPTVLSSPLTKSSLALSVSTVMPSWTLWRRSVRWEASAFTFLYQLLRGWLSRCLSWEFWEPLSCPSLTVCTIYQQQKQCVNDCIVVGFPSNARLYVLLLLLPFKSCPATHPSPLSLAASQLIARACTYHAWENFRELPWSVPAQL